MTRPHPFAQIRALVKRLGAEAQGGTESVAEQEATPGEPVKAAAT